jgi:hypothetical protein
LRGLSAESSLRPESVVAYLPLKRLVDRFNFLSVQRLRPVLGTDILWWQSAFHFHQPRVKGFDTKRKVALCANFFTLN